jgi:integrase
MHLYQAGIHLPLVSELLGHSPMETSLIYAYADTEMKRAASDKNNQCRKLYFHQ